MKDWTWFRANWRSLASRIKLRTRLQRPVRLLQDLRREKRLDLDVSKPKVAVIEYNFFHGEIIPSFVSGLNDLGITPDVFVSDKIIALNPFRYAPELKCYVRSTDDWFFKYHLSRRGLRDYDVLILNSVEPKRVLQRVSEIQVPLIGGVHNADWLRHDPDYIRFFSRPQRRPVVLAEFIANSLADDIDVHWVWPIVSCDRVTAATSTPIRLSVPGNLSFSRRNYASLLDALARLRSLGIDNVRVSIIGRSNDHEGIAFRREVAARGLDPYFQFSKSDIDYKTLYEAIGATHFILPLVDTTSETYAPYFGTKLSSPVYQAVSFGIVPIIHTRLAHIYGIEGQSIVYEDGRLAEAIIEAINRDEAAVRQMRQELRARKERLRRTSTTQLREALREVGVTAGLAS